MNRRIVYVILLVIMVAVLIMPMLTHNSIVKLIEDSSDMDTHLRVINGELNIARYYGAIILGYILNLIIHSDVSGTAYLWFNFVALVAVALGLIYITRQLVNKEAAMLIIPVALFCTTGILALFQYGVIFNIINMYLILPFALYFTVRWFVGGKYWNAIVAIALVALFSVTHYTALYLPYAIGLAIVLSGVYVVVVKKSKHLKKIIPFGAVIIILNLGLSFMFLRNAGALHRQAIPFLLRIPETIYVEVSSLVLTSFEIGIGSVLLMHLSLVTISILAISAIGLFLLRKDVVLSQGSKIFLFILGCFIVVMSCGLIVSGIAGTNRLAIDLATVIAIFTACIAGIVLKTRSYGWSSMLFVAIVTFGVVPNIVEWVR